MPIKYKVLICFSILAVFFGFYGYNNGETQLTSNPNPTPAKKGRNAVITEKQVKNEDMVAAIIIMPKSYLPALKRFSQSPMAKNIKIMRAQLEEKDGQLTAVRQDKRLKVKSRNIEPAIKPADTPPQAISKLPPDRGKQIVSAGILYLLASTHPSRTTR
jgi:hypothetical protein